MKKVFIVTNYPYAYEDGIVVDVCDTREDAEKVVSMFYHAMITEIEMNRYKDFPIGKYYRLVFEVYEGEINVCDEAEEPMLHTNIYSFSSEVYENICSYASTCVFVKEGESLSNKIREVEAFLKENVFDKKLTVDEAEKLYGTITKE